MGCNGWVARENDDGQGRAGDGVVPEGQPAGRFEHWLSRERFHEVPLATILTTVGVVFAAVFLVVLLWVIRGELILLLMAGFFAVLLSPPVALLERWGLRRSLATTLVFIVGLLAFAGLAFLFGVPLVDGVSSFAREAPHLVADAQRGHGAVGRLVKQLHLETWVRDNAPHLSSIASSISKPALSLGAAAITTIFKLVTVVVLSLYLLLEMPVVIRWVLARFPRERAARIYLIGRDASTSVTRYMAGNLLTSLVAGVVVFVTLSVLHVPFALLLALWVGLVDLLPMVGGLLAGVPTVLLAFIHSPTAGVVTLVVFLVLQQVENHVLNPIVMAKTVKMSPFWVLVAVLVAAQLGARVAGGFGAFIGALVGIPIGGAAQVVIRASRAHPLGETVEADDVP